MSVYTQIAKAANTSTATVSRVINNRDGVSDELRQRVRQAAEKFDFRSLAQANRSTNIAVVLNNDHPIFESFTSAILSGISRFSYEQGVDTTMLCIPNKRATYEEILSIIRQRSCDAAVLVFPHAIQGNLSQLTRSGIPVMMINSRRDVDDAGYVDNDSFGGVYTATRYLVDLGHRRIGFLCGTMKAVDHPLRLNGYQKAMADAELPIEKNWIAEHTPTYLSSDAGYNEMRHLLKRAPEITAVIATNDDMAYGAIHACADAGLRVPDDISIIGFDDYLNSKHCNPPLTTIRQPLDELGYRAAKYAQAMTGGDIVKVPREILPTELVIRKSTAPPNSHRA
jgi:DNA-binding LacI/PurR family transcriptional regulator